MDNFELFGKKYREFISGKIPYHEIASLTFARFGFVIHVEKSISEDLKRNEKESHLSEDILKKMSSVIDNDFFDFELINEVLKIIKKDIPPQLQEEIVSTKN